MASLTAIVTWVVSEPLARSNVCERLISTLPLPPVCEVELIVMAVLPVIVVPPTEQETVAAPEVVAVKIVAATPLASVVSIAGEKYPALEGDTVKVTT